MSGFLDITSYFDWIYENYGYHIAIKDFAGFLTKDDDLHETNRPYYIHKNDYCMYIKRNEHIWDCCQLASKRLRNKCLTSAEPFTGICYCGFSEFVIPIRFEKRVIGAICVGGFELSPVKSKRRRDKLIRQYSLDAGETERKYHEAIQVKSLDLANVLRICEMIGKYFALYYSLLLEKRILQPNSVYSGDTSRWYILSHAEEYIRQNYMNDIHVADIAAFCRCSESYISHIFKKGTHVSINRYINNVRVEKAKEYISEEGGNFFEIAGRCGFSDPNYFSYVFKSIARMTPSQYKKSAGRQK